MISLDTTVMVRIFVDDPQCPEQNSKAQQVVSEYETIFAAALQLYSNSNIDFADALILQNSAQQNLKLLSFDRKLQKQHLNPLIARFMGCMLF